MTRTGWERKTPVPQAATFVDGHLGGAAVAGEGHRVTGCGGELVGGADLRASGAGPAPPPAQARRIVQVGVDLPESGVARQRPGRRHRRRQVTKGLAHIRAVGHDVDHPVAAGSGDQGDQLASHRGLGRPSRSPQPCQHRECDRPLEKRQLDHDRRDDEGVASGEFGLAGRDLAGSVVGPARGMDLTAPAPKQCVIDRHGDRRPGRGQPANDQPQHDQAEVVGTPAGGGEEPVRPAVMPHTGHPRRGQHPAHRPPRRGRDQTGQQGGEGVEPTDGETRPGRLQQAGQRSRQTLTATHSP